MPETETKAERAYWLRSLEDQYDRTGDPFFAWKGVRGFETLKGMNMIPAWTTDYLFPWLAHWMPSTSVTRARKASSSRALSRRPSSSRTPGRPVSIVGPASAGPAPLPQRGGDPAAPGRLRGEADEEFASAARRRPGPQHGHAEGQDPRAPVGAC